MDYFDRCKARIDKKYIFDYLYIDKCTVFKIGDMVVKEEVTFFKNIPVPLTSPEHKELREYIYRKHEKFNSDILRML